MRDAGEFFRLVAVAADDAAAVTEDPHDAAVLPVRAAVLVGQLQQAQDVVDHLDRNLVFDLGRRLGPMLRQRLEIRYEARPGTAFELVQHRSWMFCHALYLRVRLMKKPSEPPQPPSGPRDPLTSSRLRNATP